MAVVEAPGARHVDGLPGCLDRDRELDAGAAGLDRLRRSARDRVERERVAAAGRQAERERDHLQGKEHACHLQASKQKPDRHRLTRTGDSRHHRVSSTNEAMPRHEEDGLVEARALAKLLAENRDWVDAEELEDEELFERLVALLSNPGRVRDDAFALAARDASKFLRAGTLAAIAGGRKPPAEWADRAKKRFARAEYGERQLLLRALAVVPTRSILAVLEAAEQDWSGSPLAADVSTFLDARVAQGERLTTAELAKLDVGLQALVTELLEGATTATRTALAPAMDEWRQQSVDTAFFRELGRLDQPR